MGRKWVENVGSVLCQAPKIQLYYFLTFSTQACVLPFLNLQFRRAGLSEDQIGIIGALRPWISAPASFGWAYLADRLSLHRPMFLSCYLGSVLARSIVSVPLLHPFAGTLGAMLTSEVLSSPVSVLADSAVVASLPDSKQYGRLRMWGAAGWGLVSALVGVIIARYGMLTAWYMHWAGCALTLCVATFSIPFNAEGKQAADLKPLVAAPAASGAAMRQQQQQEEEEEEEEGGFEEDGSMAESAEAPLVARPGNHPAAAVELSDMTGRVEQRKLLADGSGGSLSREPSSIPAEMRGEGTDDSQGEETLKNLSSGNEGDVDLVEVSMDDDQAAAVAAAVVIDPQEGGRRDEAEEEDATVLLCEDYDAERAESRGSVGVGAMEAAPEASEAAPETLRELLCSTKVLLFLSLVLVMGTAVGVIDGFLFLYLDELGGPETLMGLCLTFTCISETPIFYFSSNIITSLGVDGTLNLVLGAFVGRLLAYSTLVYWPSPWMVLPVELLHGITFGCAWAAGTHKCAQLAPGGLRATMLGLFKATYFGAGRGLGALAGGIIYEKHGAARMYQAALCWVTAGWVIQTLASAAIRQRQRATATAAVGI